MSFLPNLGNLSIDPQKLKYLLQDDLGKAKFFAGCGFHPSRPLEFDAALRQHPALNHYYNEMYTTHGVKYEIRCSMPTPNGRNPCVKSIWIIDAGHQAPRLVTCYAQP